MQQIEHYELTEPRAVGVRLRAGCMVRVSHGRLWLTRQGHALDVWLQTGESWTQPTTGTVWLSAEPSAQFQLVQVLQPWPALAQLRRVRPDGRRGITLPLQALHIA